MNSLTLTDVRKSFVTPKKQTVVAVDGVSLQVEEGKIHGLLGPNGAGKSTLISMISGMLRPDSGSVCVLDVDVIAQPDEAKRLLGVVPQEIVYEMAFTVYEILYYYSGMFGVPAPERDKRIAEVLEDLDLTDKMHERAKNLSGGMKRRLMIAKAILHRPKFLILDEPTAGVDVTLRQKIWNLVRRLNQEGTTILFTTHYLEEAEQLCESITLIDHGRVIKNGKLKDIQQEFSKNVIHFELFNRTVPHLAGVEEAGSEYEFPMTDLHKDMALITAHYKGNVKSIRSESASLEEIFLKLTKRS